MGVVLLWRSLTLTRLSVSLGGLRAAAPGTAGAATERAAGAGPTKTVTTPPADQQTATASTPTKIVPLAMTAALSTAWRIPLRG